MAYVQVMIAGSDQMRTVSKRPPGLRCICCRPLDLHDPQAPAQIVTRVVVVPDVLEKLTWMKRALEWRVD